MTDFTASSDAAQLAGRLRSAGAELGKLEPVNRRAGELVAAGPAPRRSGRLAASVQAVASATGVVVAGSTRYWTYVHWGAPRRNIAARPWLLQQLQTHEADLVGFYTDHATAVVADI